MKDTFTAPLKESAAALPRVLIVGQTFTRDTGGGITLSSLFKGWPKDKLAVAVESKEGIDFERCSHYFRIGYRELKMPFPFSVFQRKTRSGPIAPFASIGEVTVKPAGRMKNRVKAMFDNFLHYSGLFFWMYGNEKVSPELLLWIKDFNPELLYFQPNSYKSIGFVLELNRQLNLPLVTHVMDDWFDFAVRPSPLKKFWQGKLEARVRALFQATRLHLSICDYMSQEYQKRYGYHFFSFHNTVDPAFWYAGKKPGQLNSPVHLLYAGRLGNGVNDSLVRICGVVEKMAAEGSHVLFEIQTRDQDHPLVATLKRFEQVRVSAPIDYDQLRGKFAAADILLIPCDFRGPGLTFIRLSMPTKVSEYMASGTPVLVIGPPETALVEYAKTGWASVCLSDQSAVIANAINGLISSAATRERVTAEARRLVLQNHDEQAVIHQFRQKLTLLTTLATTLN